MHISAHLLALALAKLTLSAPTPQKTTNTTIGDPKPTIDPSAFIIAGGSGDAGSSSGFSFGFDGAKSKRQIDPSAFISGGGTDAGDSGLTLGFDGATPAADTPIEPAPAAPPVPLEEEATPSQEQTSPVEGSDPGEQTIPADAFVVDGLGSTDSGLSFGFDKRSG
ncbi:MAG: hypothetical protein M1825_005662 [Sarcosagium campestre]|nr:MAG: hypothetical protein M1825_005662 [Sarcosagium campestre]